MQNKNILKQIRSTDTLNWLVQVVALKNYKQKSATRDIQKTVFRVHALPNSKINI